jgi:orotate phosphoribosyltransferase
LVVGSDVSDKAVLLVEDLITNGKSKLHFIDAVSEAGGVVKDCIVLLDREQSGQETLIKERRVKLHALTTLSELLEYGGSTELLTREQFASLLDWQKDPAQWSKEHGEEPSA